MVSAEQLEARIEEFTARIKQRNEVPGFVHELERIKRLLQRQLNVLRPDRISRLPLELSSLILRQCLPPHPQPDSQSILMTLLTVCRSWTDIVLAAPSLWTAIYTSSAPPAEQSFRRWVQHACNHPLDISVNGIRAWCRVANLVLPHSAQLQRLDISLELHYRGHETRLGDGFWPSVLEILRQSPKLVEFNCQVFQVGRLQNGTAGLVLPNLHRMKFGGHTSTTEYRDDILTIITAPRLEALTLPMDAASGNDLLAFIQRSSPPLQKLVIGNGPSGNARHGFTQMANCLTLLPSLTHLEFGRLRSPVIEDALFTMLAGDLSLVPDLHTVKFSNCQYIPPGRSLDLLLQCILARRGMRLHSVRLVLTGYDSLHFPMAELLIRVTARSAFREFCKNGMDIWIGSGSNLIFP